MWHDRFGVHPGTPLPPNFRSAAAASPMTGGYGSVFSGTPNPLYRDEAFGPTLPSDVFTFRQRSGRINWRLLHSVDIDRVVREGDISTLQTFMDNITFAKFGPDDLNSMRDEDIIRLVHLAQLCLEYLIHNCSLSNDALERLADKVKSQTLQLKASEAAYPPRDKSLRKTSKSRSETIVARLCPYCPKRFRNEQYLSDHLFRRHRADYLQDPPTETPLAETLANQTGGHPQEPVQRQPAQHTAIAPRTSPRSSPHSSPAVGTTEATRGALAASEATAARTAAAAASAAAAAAAAAPVAASPAAAAAALPQPAAAPMPPATPATPANPEFTQKAAPLPPPESLQAAMIGSEDMAKFFGKATSELKATITQELKESLLAVQKEVQQVARDMSRFQASSPTSAAAGGDSREQQQATMDAMLQAKQALDDAKASTATLEQKLTTSIAGHLEESTRALTEQIQKALGAVQASIPAPIPASSEDIGRSAQVSIPDPQTLEKITALGASVEKLDSKMTQMAQLQDSAQALMKRLEEHSQQSLHARPTPVAQEEPKAIAPAQTATTPARVGFEDIPKTAPEQAEATKELTVDQPESPAEPDKDAEKPKKHEDEQEEEEKEEEEEAKPTDADKEMKPDTEASMEDKPSIGPTTSMKDKPSVGPTTSMKEKASVGPAAEAAEAAAQASPRDAPEEATAKPRDAVETTESETDKAQSKTAIGPTASDAVPAESDAHKAAKAQSSISRAASENQQAQHRTSITRSALAGSFRSFLRRCREGVPQPTLADPTTTAPGPVLSGLSAASQGTGMGGGSSLGAGVGLGAGAGAGVGLGPAPSTGPLAGPDMGLGVGGLDSGAGAGAGAGLGLPGPSIGSSVAGGLGPLATPALAPSLPQPTTMPAESGKQAFAMKPSGSTLALPTLPEMSEAGSYEGTPHGGQSQTLSPSPGFQSSSPEETSETLLPRNSGTLGTSDSFQPKKDGFPEFGNGTTTISAFRASGVGLPTTTTAGGDSEMVTPFMAGRSGSMASLGSLSSDAVVEQPTLLREASKDSHDDSEVGPIYAAEVDDGENEEVMAFSPVVDDSPPKSFANWGQAVTAFSPISDDSPVRTMPMRSEGGWASAPSGGGGGGGVFGNSNRTSNGISNGFSNGNSMGISNSLSNSANNGGGRPAGFSGPPAGFSGPPTGFSGPPAGFSGPPASFSGPPAGFSGPPASFSGPPAGFSGPPRIGGMAGPPQASPAKMDDLEMEEVEDF